MHIRKILSGLTEQHALRKFRRRHNRELGIEMMMAEGAFQGGRKMGLAMSYLKSDPSRRNVHI